MSSTGTNAGAATLGGPSPDEIGVHICHAWQASRRYTDAVELVRSLGAQGGMPKLQIVSDTAHGIVGVPLGMPEGQARLRRALRQQVERADVLLLPAGLLWDRRHWVEMQLDLARAAGKRRPIALTGHASDRGPPPYELEYLCSAVLGWNAEALSKALRPE